MFALNRYNDTAAAITLHINNTIQTEVDIVVKSIKRWMAGRNDGLNKGTIKDAGEFLIFTFTQFLQ